MSVARKLFVAAVTMAILLGLNQIFDYGVGDFQVNPYYARIVNLIGINITLAVSLNLINGLAGQFSIGHAGSMAAAAAGLVVGIPSLRLKGDYLAIVTLGFGEIIRVVILNIPAVGGATGFTDAIPITNFFWIFAMAIMTSAIVRNIAVSTCGRALAAVRADEIAAEAMGVDTTRYKVLAFVISAAL